MQSYPFAYVIKHYAMKTYGRVMCRRVYLTSASRSCRFILGERAPGTHCIGWMGPRAGLDDMEK
jgi:hypothetical protein